MPLSRSRCQCFVRFAALFRATPYAYVPGWRGHYVGATRPRYVTGTDADDALPAKDGHTTSTSQRERTCTSTRSPSCRSLSTATSWPRRRGGNGWRPGSAANGARGCWGDGAAASMCGVPRLARRRHRHRVPIPLARGRPAGHQLGDDWSRPRVALADATRGRNWAGLGTGAVSARRPRGSRNRPAPERPPTRGAAGRRAGDRQDPSDPGTARAPAYPDPGPARVRRTAFAGPAVRTV